MAAAQEPLVPAPARCSSLLADLCALAVAQRASCCTPSSPRAARLDWNCGWVIAPEPPGFSIEAQFPIFNRAEYDRYVALGEVGYMREKTSSRGCLHPGASDPLSAAKRAPLCSASGQEAATSDGSVFFIVHALLTTTLGLAGLVATDRQRAAAHWLSCSACHCCFFPMPYYITHAEFRYRLVIDPLLTILAVHCAEKS